MKKITVNDAVNIFAGLSKISTLSEDKANEVPFNVSYRVARGISALLNSVQKYEEVRQKLLSEYGQAIMTEDPDKKDKDGKPLMLPNGEFIFNSPEAHVNFKEKVADVLKEEIELDDTIKLSLSELEKIKNLNVSTLVQLDKIIEE